MSKITADKYVHGVNSIYVEQPTYRHGGDGSDGTCDCIGMPRGALKREGVTDVKNMGGTNMAARKCIENLREISSVSDLQLGDVVLKTRDKDDPDYPLPDRYRKGHADYDPKWGETNFTHIGTVTGLNPLEITHMTSPTAKKDTKIGNWKYSGKLPWVERGQDPKPDPGPDPVPETEWAVVVAQSGSTVKMRAKPTTTCRLYWDVPVGSSVIVLQEDAAVDVKKQTWSRIIWAGQEGYMLKTFLQFEEEPAEEKRYTVIIPNLTKQQAEELRREWSGATMKEG